MALKHTIKRAWNVRTLWLTVLAPVLLLPLPLVYPGEVAKCGYCVLLIGFYWVTELLPLAVTSLLPVVLFPLLGIMSAKDTCSSYAKDTLMLFMGSLIVAVAVERWNLHRRLALRTLSLVGPQPKWLMFGIMLPCWFLSMWMSNTATAAMMMPIVNAILEQIKITKQHKDSAEKTVLTKNSDDEVDLCERIIERRHSVEDVESDRKAFNMQEDEEDFTRMAKSFSLCVAYAANVGGMATLTGTPPNVIFKGQADLIFSKMGGSAVNFANWMTVGFPVSAVLFLVAWGWLYIYTVRSRILKCSKDYESYDAVRSIIARETNKLGTIKFPEVIVLISFVLLALLWVTRKPGFIPGWDNLVEKRYSGDSTPAILIGIVLFILPAKKSALGGTVEYEPILNWKTVNEKMAWGVLLLMGGGFALADGCQRSGLSSWVSGHLLALATLSPWIISLLLCVIISLATQVTSNAATATLFLPIVGDLGISLGVNPLYFMIPSTLSTSLAFLLPVATPPNAIVFSSGYLKVKDMVAAGIVINLISLFIINVAINTWAVPYYKLDVYPDIFRLNSSTQVPSLLNFSLLTSPSN